MLKHFSLFTGIGGIDKAAEWAGFESVGMCEIDEYCQKVLDKHWPHVPKWRDIFDLTGKEIVETCGEIDIISGGFPCQPFSAAGKRKGCADERHLWPELLRIVCEVKPRWFLGENVRGLLSIDSGRVFGRILQDLAENGYRVGWLCYGAGDVGAPHKRERVFILGYSESNGNSQQRCTHKRENGSGEDRPIIPNKSSRFDGEGALADTEGTEGPVDRTIVGKQEQGQPGRRSGETDMADTDHQRGCLRQTRDKDAENVGQSSRCETGAKRPAESSMGRVPPRISAGMDGSWPAGQWQTPTVEDSGRTGSAEAWQEWEKEGRTTQCRLRNQVWAWPAGPGNQHEWEPPRIATGIKDRVSRLKCLGNAVVPQQVYPILRAVAEVVGDKNKGGAYGQEI